MEVCCSEECGILEFQFLRVDVSNTFWRQPQYAVCHTAGGDGEWGGVIDPLYRRGLGPSVLRTAPVGERGPDLCDFLGCLAEESPPPILIILSISLCAVAQRFMGWPACRLGMAGLGEYLCLFSFSCCGAPVGSQDMVLDLDNGWWWRLAALESRTAILMLNQWYRILAGLMAVVCHGSWARECALGVVLRSHAPTAILCLKFLGFLLIGKWSVA